MSRNFTDPSFANIDQIEPNLYLGARSAAADIKTLEKYEITHILTIEDMALPEKITSLKNVKYIQLSDLPQEDLLSYLDQTDEFISEGLVKGAVLVHCLLGISRSASLVLAHIMKKYNFNYDEAFKMVQQKRPIVSPNSGFVSQLNLYREMGYTLDPTNQKYRSIQLNAAANTFMFFKTLPHKYLNLIRPDPGLDQIEPKMSQSDRYCCKKCHRILALESNMLTHKYEGKLCTNKYFLEPLAWMNASNHNRNKLFCPQCKAEVGAFCWIAGYRCSCDVKVAPAFWLTPTVVEVAKSNLI